MYILSISYCVNSLIKFKTSDFQKCTIIEHKYDLKGRLYSEGITILVMYRDGLYLITNTFKKIKNSL